MVCTGEPEKICPSAKLKVGSVSDHVWPRVSRDIYSGGYSCAFLFKLCQSEVLQCCDLNTCLNIRTFPFHHRCTVNCYGTGPLYFYGRFYPTLSLENYSPVNFRILLILLTYAIYVFVCFVRFVCFRFCFFQRVISLHHKV